MKLTFLGTAAAEGCPAVFCNCRYCAEAREKGGKDIRTRSQSLINDDLLIDLPADTYHHFLQNRIRGDRIKHLLITHGHGDHYYPKELFNRGSCYAHNMEVQTLDVICPETVFLRVTADVAEADRDVARGLAIHLARPFQTMKFGDYEITPLPAKHAFGQSAVIYVIRQGDKTLLYAHDTGYPYREVLDYIREKGLYFNFATFDCTNAHLPIDDSGSHMGFDNVGRLIEELKGYGAIDENSLLYVNHFSHNGDCIHERMTESAARVGCKVSYDGCGVEF